jgi:Na+:H+ antiporter, NhaA family
MAMHRNTQGDQGLPELELPIEDRDHHQGPLDARYSLVEYGDYAAPACRDLEPILAELRRELGDDLCFAFRHFPGPDGPSRRAAEVAEAADEQGKFWLMHDRLFAHADELGEPLFHNLARALPLQMDTFDRDLASGEAARDVEKDLASGRESGVAATPALFVNGRLHVGSYEFLPLLKAIRGET